MNPVFILAAPRSGTTWLVRTLNAHPDVYATELRAFGEYVDVVQDQGASKPRLRITLDEYINALLTSHQWTSLSSSRDEVRDDILSDIYATLQHHALQESGKAVFVDKLTPYLGTADRAVASIAKIFPQAKVIVLLRDGRDVAVSGIMHWLTKTIVGESPSAQQRLRRSFFLENGPERPERFFTDDELAAWARHWREPIDAMQVHGGRLESLAVRYECMSRDAGAEFARICSFIGIDSSVAVVRECVEASTFEVMSGGRRRGEDAPGQHVRKGIVGDWRRLFTAADAMLFDRVAGSRLIESGYEPDRSWIAHTPEQLALQRA
ncbi:MAG TPA: sulfotransferase [Vicinamibacterales bacterium]|nr:sulfotransferase [Vicinamibacterales bacterium]